MIDSCTFSLRLPWMNLREVLNRLRTKMNLKSWIEWDVQLSTLQRGLYLHWPDPVSRYSLLGLVQYLVHERQVSVDSPGEEGMLPIHYVCRCSPGCHHSQVCSA